jgi:serine/threonine protein kinase
MHHPWVVQLYDLLQDEDNYYVILEFCPNGELFEYIVAQGRLAEPDARRFAVQLLHAIRYIHAQGIAHRYLKPENIFIDEHGNAKVGDFGLARFFRADGLVDTPCGSPCYASPECLSGAPFDGRTSDVWSLGVIAYAMVTGALPWTSHVQSELFQQIANGDYRIPSKVSPQCRDFLRGMLTVSTAARLTVDQALAHPWLAPLAAARPGHAVLPYVSLEKIDQFFHRDERWQEIPPAQIKKEQSAGCLSVNKAVQYILEKKSPSAPASAAQILFRPLVKATSTGPSHKVVEHLGQSEAGCVKGKKRIIQRPAVKVLKV